MSEYTVGQKVRVVWAATLEGSGYVGRVGTITEIDTEFWDEPLYGLDVCPLELDEFDDIFWGWFGDQLEPAADEHEASEYTYRDLMDRLKAGEVECV
jgi:hypothetical protein